VRLNAAGGISTAAAAACLEFETAAQPKSVVYKIHFDRFGFFHEAFIDQELEIVDIEHLVVISWLVQSQCQRRAASTALVEKYADRLHLSTLEILSDLSGRRFSDFHHDLPP
jgi:hypothetical protein